MNVVSLLTRSAVRHPRRPAVTVGRHVLATCAQVRLCLRHVTRFKRPRAYRFVESLPKNNNGKC